MEALVGVVVIAVLILVLVKLLGTIRNMGRQLIGKPSVNMEKAQKLLQERSKDMCILRSDFAELYKLINKEFRNPDDAMTFLKNEADRLGLRVIGLPNDMTQTMSEGKFAVNNKVNSVLKTFNMEYYFNNGHLAEANKEKYNQLIGMTLFALPEMNTVAEARAYVDERLEKVYQDYKQNL